MTDARNKALRLLTVMDRSEHELRTKLKERGFAPEEVDDAISYVKSYDYLEDARYTTHYIKYHREQKSKYQIIHELKKKGIEEALIHEGFLPYEPYDEIPLIIRLAKKKMQGVEPSFSNIEKCKAYLYRKGFSTSDIHRAMEEYGLT